ncbi:hypothetical protein D7D52_29515 [Nocardia yunnanensis]|uniref:Uncharacterized protein n=1 Tax=Nocardia yunnanensis TaxID=2382165 RepID=A0A386ZIA1_9NOCA|nr:hypothetical protein [Nocardia yunnanensis]AYF77277.1 hypothetical protein D7D52_29515 [Nocardia yunnanensis]
MAVYPTSWRAGAAAYTGAVQKIAERAIVITVEAHNWNCVKFIRPRFTKQRLDEAIALERRDAAAEHQRLRAEVERLRSENEALRARVGDAADAR